MMKNLLAIVPLLIACGAGTSGVDGGPGPDADHADATPDSPVVRYFRGIYFVPERTDVSTYPVDEAEWVVAGTRVTLAYNLPRLLVGGSERVAFTGTASADGTTAELAGAAGTASCTLDVGGMPISCLEDFVDIMVDLDRVRREAMTDDPARVEERVAVSTGFSNDPIGVIEATEVLRGPETLSSCTTDVDCGGTRCDIEIPGEVGFCEPEGGDLASGAACELSIDCTDDLECEFERGVGTCAPHGG